MVVHTPSAVHRAIVADVLNQSLGDDAVVDGAALVLNILVVAVVVVPAVVGQLLRKLPVV